MGAAAEGGATAVLQRGAAGGNRRPHGVLAAHDQFGRPGQANAADFWGGETAVLHFVQIFFAVRPPELVGRGRRGADQVFRRHNLRRFDGFAQQAVLLGRKTVAFGQRKGKRVVSKDVHSG